MIELQTNNPQIILMALAIFIGAIAALFYAVSEFRKSSIAWERFKAARRSLVLVNSDALARGMRRLGERPESKTGSAERTLRELAEDLAEWLALENPGFDRKAFVRACAGEATEVEEPR